MRVLLTVHTYYPNNDGVQFVTEYLSEGLAKNGNDVTIVTNLYPDKTKNKDEYHNGVRIIRVKAYTKHTIHCGQRKKYINLIKELSLENDIMVNVCTQCATTDWILKELKNIKIPKVLYLHSIWDFKYKKEDIKNIKNLCSKIFANIRWRMYYIYNTKNFKKYDAVTQIHKMDYSYDFFEKRYGIKSIIIENAAEECFFNNDFEIIENLPKKYIINVSNYLKRKNQEKAVLLFLKSNIPDDWELILIGSQKNSYYDKIFKIYENYKKENGKKIIKFLYNVPRKQIATYVKKASLYLMTSKWEAFPISLIETMASGVPFISSDVGIVKYLPGGVICKKENEYLYWLEEFTNNYNLRKKYGELGKMKAISNYSIKSKIEQFENLLKKIKA